MIDDLTRYEAWVGFGALRGPDQEKGRLHTLEYRIMGLVVCWLAQ